MSKLFTPILIPAGIEKKGTEGHALFTLWFQLNANHDAFSKTWTGPIPENVFSSIKKLPGFANNLKNKRVAIVHSNGSKKLDAYPFYNGADIVTPEGVEFYSNYFDTVTTSSKIRQLIASQTKFFNAPLTTNAPIRSILHDKGPIGPLDIDTPIEERLEVYNDAVDSFNKLNEQIRTYSETAKKENLVARRQLMDQVKPLMSKIGEFSNRIDEADSFISVAPSYVEKAFNALTQNIYTQSFTGIFITLSINFNELVTAFGATKKMSIQIDSFNDSDLDALCLPDANDLPNLPTCLRLISKKSKYAVLLDTYSNAQDPASPDYFPYDEHFENSILKTKRGSKGSPLANLATHEEIGRIFSERAALMKAVEFLKKLPPVKQKHSFNTLLALRLRDVQSKKILASKAATDPVERLQRAIDYLEYCHDKAMAEEELLKSLKSADEKLTSGLTIVHPEWHKLIKPERDEVCFLEHSLIKGYAIAVQKPEADQKTSFVSLTRRKEFLTIHRVNGTTLSKEDDTVRFGSVSADALMNAMQPVTTPGESSTVHVTDNVLFTWLGTCLGLKNPNQGHETDEEGTDNAQDDVDLETQVLSQRTGRLFDVDFFPFLKRKAIQGQPLKQDFTFLNIGMDSRVLTPRLLFSRKTDYQFLFYAQYINGWQLPLNSDVLSSASDMQLTVEEMIEGDELNFYFKGKFTRNEHIKAVKLFHTENIFDENCYDGNGNFNKNCNNRKGKEGESLEHLVIRSLSGSHISNEISARHILPPETSPQIAQWHGKFLKKNMAVKDVHQWHLKYHCRLSSQNEFQEKGCSNKCHLFCGNHNMKPFYKTDVIYPNYLPDPLAEGFKIQFYRDAETSIPASIYGYRDIYCKFKNGTYPALQSWKLVLKDGEPSYRSSNKVFKNDSEQTITIYLPQGLELYAKLVTFYDRNQDDVVVNKLITSSTRRDSQREFREKFKLLSSQDEFDETSGLSLKETAGDDDYFETFATKIILTHAVRQPLIRPEILDVKLRKFCPQSDNSAGIIGKSRSAVQAIMELRFEMLNVIKCYLQGSPNNHFTFINGTQPTGDLELWGKWEDFADNPNKSYKPPNLGDLERLRELHSPRDPQISINDDNNKFKFLGKIKFENKAHVESLMHLALEKLNRGNDLSFTDFTTKLIFDFDIEKTQATSIIFQVRNTSKWNGFFTPLADNEKPSFQLVSAEFARLLPSDPAKISSSYTVQNGVKISESDFYLNNEKPKPPLVSRIIPMVVTDAVNVSANGKDYTKQTTRYNRFRIFLKRSKDSLMNASSDERMAVIIKSAKSYNDYFQQNELLSRVGTDWITDTGRIIGDKTYLTSSNFNTNRSDLEDHYWSLFEPMVFNTDSFMDLIHYRFHFDSFRNHWYFDIEIDFKDDKGNEYHNPFVQLGLATFYEPGLYYLDPADTLPHNDFRISEIQKTGFVSLLPSRSVTARMYTPNLFRKHGQVQFSLECNLNSLFFDKSGKLRSQVYVGIRETYRHTSQFISSVDILNNKTSLFHPLLDDKLKAEFEMIDNNKIAVKMTTLEFERKGIFGHKYELVLAEMENFLVDIPVDINNPEFFKLPGQRIKYIEII